MSGEKNVNGVPIGSFTGQKNGGFLSLANSTRSTVKELLAVHKLYPHYSTDYGDAYVGDSNNLLQSIPDSSISLVMTSPPFALRRKKSYGNPEAEDYIEWFRPFAKNVLRVLKPDGSFVIEIGGAWMPGTPTRSIYQYELLIDLVKKLNFHLAQEFFWFNPAKMPGPAQWVNIERIRCTDAVNTIWWLSKSARPKANNKRVLQPYGDSMKELLEKGYNSGPRPSGHIVSEKWQVDHGGAIPKNLLTISNTNSQDFYQKSCREVGIPLHPARFPRELPEFFVNLLTDGNDDLVLDIFAGSNVTGAVAEGLRRQWLAIEENVAFLEASKFRFNQDVSIKIAKGIANKANGTNIN
jgi:site-specific DNA-methyltransferase (cytosine-N4-specific)